MLTWLSNLFREEYKKSPTNESEVVPEKQESTKDTLARQYSYVFSPLFNGYCTSYTGCKYVASIRDNTDSYYKYKSTTLTMPDSPCDLGQIHAHIVLPDYKSLNLLRYLEKWKVKGVNDNNTMTYTLDQYQYLAGNVHVIGKGIWKIQYIYITRPDYKSNRITMTYTKYTLHKRIYHVVECPLLSGILFPRKGIDHDNIIIKVFFTKDTPREKQVCSIFNMAYYIREGDREPMIRHHNSVFHGNLDCKVEIVSGSVSYPLVHRHYNFQIRKGVKHNIDTSLPYTFFLPKSKKTILWRSHIYTYDD